MQLAGMVEPPLDELVFAQDADEFLAAVAEHPVELRMQITPCFISPKALGLAEDMLPAGGTAADGPAPFAPVGGGDMKK
jgi:hypothetical protein